METACEVPKASKAMKPTIHPFIQHKSLSIFHVLGPEPHTGNTVINKTETSPCFKGIYDFVKDNKLTDGWLQSVISTMKESTRDL